MKYFLALSLIAASLAPTAGSFAQDDADAAFTDAVRAAVNEIAPSVLRIETFGGLEKVGDVLIGSGPSTGLAVSEDGYVLCSAYSFAQQPTSILVTMPSGKRASAKVVARDHSRMVVLLKVNSEEKLPTPASVARKDMTVGETAIAIGRTFDVETPNVSVGIISATNRVWGKAIQTDAKISPSNYGGPLIDLQGRVLGILVPMSPQGEGALAGAQWYDSGIGFAVPLAEIMPHLDTLKRGEDLHPGKLGVSLAGKGNFTEPVEIAAVLPASPAAKAGLRKGDKIVEVAGQKVRWLAHLKHAMGARYADETVSIVVVRDEKRIEAPVTLVDDIAAYDIPFLGILPARGFDGIGVKVRFVYDDSPAAKAGVQAGDVVRSCAGTEVKNAEQLRNMVGTHDRKEGPLEVEFVRDRKTQKQSIALASLPTAIPDELPSTHAVAERGANGLVEISIPEIANQAFACVPKSYRADGTYSLVVWLNAPGEFDKSKIEPTWGDLCERHDLIVLVPQPIKPDAWQPTEAEFVRKAMDQVIDDYNIDSQRIVIGGYQAGGTFAALIGFANAELVRGVAMIDAALPGRTALPTSDPVQRMAMFLATLDDSKLKDRIDAGIKGLQSKKLPVSVLPLGKEPRPLDEDDRETLARWVDSLDRI